MNSLSFVLRGLTAAFVACASSMAFSQPSLPQSDVSLDQLLTQTQVVLGQIDAGQAEAAWEGASTIFQERATKSEFASRIKDDRAGLEKIAARRWQTFGRASYAEGNSERLPPGDYISVNYLAQDGKGQLLQELVSFRIEDEKQWRMTGYVMQKAAAR